MCDSDSDKNHGFILTTFYKQDFQRKILVVIEFRNRKIASTVSKCRQF